MVYNRKLVLPFCFMLGLLIAAAFVLGGCVSRDRLEGPTDAQRTIEPLRPVIFGWSVQS